MNQEEYYKISRSKNLPVRCPILNYCSRRAVTIYSNSDYRRYNPGLSVTEALLKDGTIPIDFEKYKIDIQGEPPTWIKGNSSAHYNNMCPEVNLFDSSHSLYPKTACVEGDYDKYRTSEQSKVIKCQHFSECSEFNKYMFDKGFFNSKNTRKSIPYKTKAILQKEINSECPFCENKDVEHFQIHHIDEDNSNNIDSNLIMLCPICHSKITKGDITIDTVKRRKESLRLL